MYPPHERKSIQHHCYVGQGFLVMEEVFLVTEERVLVTEEVFLVVEDKVCFFCLSPCAGCKTRQGDDVAV